MSIDKFKLAIEKIGTYQKDFPEWKITAIHNAVEEFEENFENIPDYVLDSFMELITVEDYILDLLLIDLLTLNKITDVIVNKKQEEAKHVDRLLRVWGVDEEIETETGTKIFN